jgi:serine/threonine protein kinase
MRNIEIMKICKMLDYVNIYNVSLIIMPYLGVDGIELINRREFSFDMFESMARTLVDTKTEIEKYGLIHGDIKLENLTYNNSKWHLIDWGLAYSDRTTRPKFVGTVPYILPQLGNVELYKEFVHELDNGDTDLHDKDYYSIAMTLLSSLNPLYQRKCEVCLENDYPCQKNRCIGKSHMVYNIEYLYKVFIGKEKFNFHDDVTGIPNSYFTHDLVKSLVQIVLSKWPVQHKYLSWSQDSYPMGSRCKTFGVNSYFQKNNDENIRNPDTKQCWEEFKNTITFLSS